MENLIDEMLDGQILLTEAIDEFEKLYIQKALHRNNAHISKTADELGIHRNTLAKKASEYKSFANAKNIPVKKSAAKSKK